MPLKVERVRPFARPGLREVRPDPLPGLDERADAGMIVVGVGILMYGKRPGLKEIIKWSRYA